MRDADPGPGQPAEGSIEVTLTAGGERGDAATRWEKLLPAYRDLAAGVS